MYVNGAGNALEVDFSVLAVKWMLLFLLLLLLLYGIYFMTCARVCCQATSMAST